MDHLKEDRCVALLVPVITTFVAIGLAVTFVPQNRTVECEVSLPAPIGVKVVAIGRGVVYE